MHATGRAPALASAAPSARLGGDNGLGAARIRAGPGSLRAGARAAADAAARARLAPRRLARRGGRPGARVAPAPPVARLGFAARGSGVAASAVAVNGRATRSIDEMDMDPEHVTFASQDELDHRCAPENPTKRRTTNPPPPRAPRRESAPGYRDLLPPLSPGGEGPPVVVVHPKLVLGTKSGNPWKYLPPPPLPSHPTPPPSSPP